MENKTEKPVKFSLEKIGYTDLDGNRILIRFNKKEFGNIIYANATSIEADEAAKAIHANGEVTTTREVLSQIDAIMQYASNYNHRVKSAITEEINTLK